MADAPSCSRICKICTETTLGSHFGVDACRACAAFFRRSIVEKKTYSCRTGGKCPIDKSIRCLCRKCRLQKCLDVGMQVDGVQGKRDPIIPKHYDPNPLYIGSPSESEVAAASPRTDLNPSGSPLPGPSNPPLDPPLLIKAMANYRQLCSVRRATELALEPETYKKMNREGLLKGYAHGTSKHMSLFFRAQISPVTEFVASTYEEFGDLSDDEKWNLLQPFFIYLWWFDCAWRTYKLVPREDYTKICVVSETMYLDVDRVDDWIDDISPESEFLRADFVKYLKKEMSPEKMQISYGIDDMKIREQEWVTLVGLMLWNTSSVHLGCTENIRSCIKRVRAKMYEDIHEYYRNCNEPSPAVRLGELMNLHSMTMVELMRSREDLEIFNTLDAFKKDDFFYEMLKITVGFVTSVIVDSITLVVYGLIFVTIYKNWKSFNTSYYKLFLFNSIMNILNYLNSWPILRLPNIVCKDCTFSDFYKQPSFIGLDTMRFFYVYFSYHLCFLEATMALNRFTAIRFNLRYQKIWKKILSPSLLIALVVPLVLSYPSYIYPSYSQYLEAVDTYMFSATEDPLRRGLTLMLFQLIFSVTILVIGSLSVYTLCRLPKTPRRSTEVKLLLHSLICSGTTLLISVYAFWFVFFPTFLNIWDNFNLWIIFPLDYVLCVSPYALIICSRDLQERLPIVSRFRARPMESIPSINL